MPSCLPSHRTSALFVLSASREGHPLQQQQLRFRPIFADFSPFLVLDGRLKLQRNLQDGLDHEARWRRVGEYGRCRFPEPMATLLAIVQSPPEKIPALTFGLLQTYVD